MNTSSKNLIKRGPPGNVLSRGDDDMGTRSKGPNLEPQPPARKTSGPSTLKARWQKAFVGPSSEERRKEAKLLIDAVRSNPAIANVGDIKDAVDELEKLMTTYASQKLPVNLIKPHLQTLKEALVNEAFGKNETAITRARTSVSTFCGQITPENLNSSLDSLRIVWVKKNAPDNMKGLDAIKNSWKEKIDDAKQSKPLKTSRRPWQKKGPYCARRALKAFGEIPEDEWFIPRDRAIKKKIAQASPDASPSEVAGEFFLHGLMEETEMIRSYLKIKVDRFLEKANETDDFTTEQIKSFQDDCKSLIEQYETALDRTVGLAAKLMNAEALSKHLRRKEREELHNYGKALLKEFLPKLLSHDRLIGKVYLWAKCCAIDPIAGLQALEGLNGDVKNNDNGHIELPPPDEFESEEIEVKDVSIPNMSGQKKIPVALPRRGFQADYLLGESPFQKPTGASNVKNTPPLKLDNSDQLRDDGISDKIGTRRLNRRLKDRSIEGIEAKKEQNSRAIDGLLDQMLEDLLFSEPGMKVESRTDNRLWIDDGSGPQLYWPSKWETVDGVHVKREE